MNKYDVAFSFDTTYSMAACIAQVRRQIKEVATDLLKKIPGIRIALIAHGDYHKESGYLMKQCDFTTDIKKLTDFVNSADRTCGGDLPEAYEYVLRESQKLSWDSEKCRALVMIGDSTPHSIGHNNPYNIDWKHEVKQLVSMGVNVYSVQCLDDGSKKEKDFWRGMATMGNGYHLYLDQFNMITQMMTAICFKQVGQVALQDYQQRLTDHLGGMTIAMKQMFDVMLGLKTVEQIETENNQRYNYGGKAPAEPKNKKIGKVGGNAKNIDDVDLKPCRPSRFQVCGVDKDCSIKQFAEDNDLEFKVGRGFYEFTKPEVISGKKEVVLQKKGTGEIYEGAAAKKLLGLDGHNEKARIAPTSFNDYKVFVQSTSYNRKLQSDTAFLYEIA